MGFNPSIPDYTITDNYPVVVGQYARSVNNLRHRSTARITLPTSIHGDKLVRLTTHLLASILINGAAVLTVALGWMIVSDHRTVVAEHEAAATSMQRILELQNIGLLQGAGLDPRNPDWYPVTQVSRPDGDCVRLLDDHGQLLRSACRGPEKRHHHRRISGYALPHVLSADRS